MNTAAHDVSPAPAKGSKKAKAPKAAKPETKGPIIKVTDKKPEYKGGFRPRALAGSRQQVQR